MGSPWASETMELAPWQTADIHLPPGYHIIQAGSTDQPCPTCLWEGSLLEG